MPAHATDGDSPLAYTKLPEETVVRIVKCLGHGCSIEATADICEVDARSVSRMLEKAGRRAEILQAIARWVETGFMRLWL